MCVIGAHLATILEAPAARSQTEEASTVLAVQIPPQPLAQALDALSLQSGLQFVYVTALVQDQRSGGAPAGLTARDALARLLEGTGLTFQFLNDRTVCIVRAPPPPPPPPIPEIIIIAEKFKATPEQRRRLEKQTQEIERRTPRHHDDELDSYLKSIAQCLLETDETDPSRVDVKVTPGADANAYALSNGSIWVSTGLLATLTSEAEVAAVLSHELAHYQHEDPLRGLTEDDHQFADAWAMDFLLDTLMGQGLRTSGTQSRTTALIPEEALRILTRASLNGYSAELERRADDAGIRRMIKAGYDPSGALAALQHLREQQLLVKGQQRPLPLLASRAHLEEHLASLRDLLAGQLAGAVGGARKVRREEYNAQVARLRFDQVSILLEAGSADRADATLDRVVGAQGDSARAEFLRGEIARRRMPRTEATVARAIAAYGRAIQLPDLRDAEAFRELGFLYWWRGEAAAAREAFRSYLERAPLAVDAPLVRSYLEQAEAIQAAAPTR
jgi:predicted Zn-dependent protease